MFEGSFPGIEDRPINGCYSQAPENELFGCLPRIPSNHFGPRGSRENLLYYTRGKYHYIVIPFELKNAGAIYQQMVTRMFKDLIGKTVEVYIDNMVVKTKESGGHACDLMEVFDVLRQHKLRLNAKKCSFKV